MNRDNAGNSDPIGDIADADIEALLERTSKLASEAGNEVGLPANEPVDASPSQPPKRAAPKPEPEPEPEPDPIDAKLADLETLLGKTANEAGTAPPPGEAQAEAEDPTGQTKSASVDDAIAAASPEPTPPAGTPAEDMEEDFDDFDISVDLSEDDEETADKEIGEKLASSTEEADEPQVDEEGLVGRGLDGGLRAIACVFTALDRPFAAVSPSAKQVIGYIAIATAVVAVGGWVFGTVMH